MNPVIKMLRVCCLFFSQIEKFVDKNLEGEEWADFGMLPLLVSQCILGFDFIAHKKKKIKKIPPKKANKEINPIQNTQILMHFK